MRPDHVLDALLRADATRPRITCYDDRTGERIELSAKVLANWVAKAANLLTEEFDAEPGTRVALALPPHWRTLYWALAVWRTGATVVLSPPGAVTGADVVVTTADSLAAESGTAESGAAPGHAGAAESGAASWPAGPAVPAGPAKAGASGAPIVAVTLAALARSAGTSLPSGAIDEARELATYADVFDAVTEADDADVALDAGGEPAAYDQVVVAAATPERVHTDTADTRLFLELALATFAAGGSVVLTIGGEASESRLAAEGVTRRC